MPEGQMPPQGAPAPEQPAEGGGAQEALNSLGEGLSTIVEAMGQDPAIPDEAKQAFQASLIRRACKPCLAVEPCLSKASLLPSKAQAARSLSRWGGAVNAGRY
jgi:hypothetical protein